MPPSVLVPGALRTLVVGQARRWRRLELLRAAGLAVAVPLGLFTATALLDSLLYLPTIGRVAAAAGVLALTVAFGYRLLQRWRTANSGEDATALAIEQATPGGVQNRLINALQLSRGDAIGDAALGSAVMTENCAALQSVALKPAASARPAVLPVLAALVLMTVAALTAVFAPERFANATGRILMPFAKIAPMYRTTLDVQPGDGEAVEGTFAITIAIRGEPIDHVTLVREINGIRREERLPVGASDSVVSHKLTGIEKTQTYEVRGGDFTSPTYKIEVASPSSLTGLRATLKPPAYTNQPARTVEVAGGDLEALTGTVAEITFAFDQPADGAVMLVQNEQPVELEKLAGNEFHAVVTIKSSVGYRLETRQGKRPNNQSGLYALRALPDLLPRMELSGLAGITDAALEAKLAVTLKATDDLGLDQVGLFARRATGAANTQPDEGWVAVQTWPGQGKPEFRQAHEFAVAALGVGEGERVEIAIRARDTDPTRANTWITGSTFPLIVGGEGAALQVQYEQLLKTEAELKTVLADEKALEEKSASWLKKLDAGSGIRWDDPKNLDMLHAAMADLAKEQKAIQTKASAAARGMLVEAGNLRMAVGLLADAELTRAIRALESVASQEQPKKRAAVGDVRVIQERSARSLSEILEQYVAFRQDWEVEHAVPFVKMLADRQAALRDESLRNTQNAPLAASAMIAGRRQTKVRDLAQLFAPALESASKRLTERDAELAAGFLKAAENLRATQLNKALESAIAGTQAGKWSEALPVQTEAARLLVAVHEELKKALADAARKALMALQDKAKSDVDAQKAIDKLKAGTDKTFVDMPNKLDLTDVKHLQDVAAKGAGDNEKLKPEMYLFTEAMKGMLQQADTGKRQQFDILKLASSPSKTPSFPNQSDREANSVKPHIQEKFDDLVGKLLEEADEINEKYETYNLNAAFNINEPGEIGKQGGDLNSTAAAAATGNMKPPTTNVGGATRSGRQGARAHGMTVGDESLNRRGRDKVQEGQERVGDQAGVMKQKKSEDPQNDTSTGVGGKKVETDDAKFSQADKGKWTDDMMKRLDKPQAKQFIVERQDGKLDPKLAEMFRDMDARQEQLIERIKAIKKELRNLYLPTEHLDEIEAQLKQSMDRLTERPDAEAYRQHREALDKLRAAVRVFSAPSGGAEASVPRERAVRGRALDEPARAPLPGYEDAVKRYYERLSR